MDVRVRGWFIEFWLGSLVEVMSNEKKKGVIYRGSIKIGDIEINCAVNEDGVRVISQTALNKAFSRPDGGAGKLPVIIDLKSLEPFTSADVIARANNLIQVEELKGFEAELIPDICEIWLKARDAGVLTEKQMITAQKADIIMRALSKIGIIALVDEATGYQYNRKKDALRLLLEQYIAEGLQKWLKRFPDKFFEQLDRLYENEKTKSRSRPMYYGKFINEYIYEPIEDGYVKEELNRLNIKDDGKRKARFHQWLSEFGSNQLTFQIGRVAGIMEDSKTLDECKLRLARQRGLTIIEEDLFGEQVEKIIRKQRKAEKMIVLREDREGNIEASKFIQNIKQDNLSLNDNNDFDTNLKKFAKSKKH